MHIKGIRKTLGTEASLSLRLSGTRRGSYLHQFRRSDHVRRGAARTENGGGIFGGILATRAFFIAVVVTS